MASFRMAAALVALAGAVVQPQVVIDGESTGVTQDELRLVSFDCRPEALAPDLARICRVSRRLEGQRLFDEETFGGNGRTCVTCHSRETGTFSASDAQSRLTANPSDPLFRHDGFDDGVSGLSRITQHATVRIDLPLPAYVTLKDDPTRRTLVVHRGTPTTLNTPAFETVFMHDLRNATLEEQALGAIEGHARNTIQPTPLQLQLIAEFERRSPRFFSSPALRRFAEGGPAPELPAGETDSQKRGRRFFVEAPFTRGAKDGVCALCHSGPLLNQGSRALAEVVPGAPVGIRDATVFVSERNTIGNPVYTFLIDDGLGRRVEMSSPDPGEILSPARLPPPGVFPRTTFFNFFKIGTLWSVSHTAPYFHDGSAKTLDDVVEQYEFFFKDNPFGLITTLTEEDKRDIVEYLKLL
jgi:cytochrome c peroxidase